MWDLCAVLPVESAFVLGGEVRDVASCVQIYVVFCWRISHLHFSHLKIIDFKGISSSTQFIFMSLMWLFFLLPTTRSWSEKNGEDTSTQKTFGHPIRTKPGLTGLLQFLFVTGILCVVGSRVASLVVLEFCLRAVSGLVTAGPVRNQLCDKNIYVCASAVSGDFSVAYSAELVFIFHGVRMTRDSHRRLLWFIHHSCSSFFPGVGEISAAAVSSKPVLSGLCPNLQFALSTRGGGPALAMLAPGSSTQLVSG